MKVIYKKGDATNPQEQNVVIAHGCNNKGAWGAGFVIPLGNKYPAAKVGYHQWDHKELGSIQLIRVNPNVHVCNMVTQILGTMDGWLIPFRYQSFAECLIRLRQKMLQKELKTLVMPRVGAGLAGGNWQTIELIINKVFDKTDIRVIIYDRPEDNWPGTIYE